MFEKRVLVLSDMYNKAVADGDTERAKRIDRVRMLEVEMEEKLSGDDLEIIREADGIRFDACYYADEEKIDASLL